MLSPAFWPSKLAKHVDKYRPSASHQPMAVLMDLQSYWFTSATEVLAAFAISPPSLDGMADWQDGGLQVAKLSDAIDTMLAVRSEPGG